MRLWAPRLRVCPVTITDDQARATADAQQAAYFRAELDAERRLLLTQIGKRRALIERPSDASRRQRASVSSVEAEVRYLDSLIARLDSRFATGEPSANR
jgi:hypothetical protein